MKTLFTIVSIVAILHVLAAAAFLGWLAGTGRLTADRVTATTEIFKLTPEQEQARDEEEARKAEQARLEAERQARLSGVGGLASTADKLADEQKRNEVMLRQLERTRREIQALSDNLTLARARMERQHADLAAAKQDLEQRIAEMEARLNDEGFKKAVTLYEQLPAKQVKQMFAELMASGRTDEVVTYLEAMDPRKAAGVLKEFKSESEVVRAVELTERLRARGSDLVDAAETTG